MEKEKTNRGTLSRLILNDAGEVGWKQPPHHRERIHTLPSMAQQPFTVSMKSNQRQQQRIKSDMEGITKIIVYLILDENSTKTPSSNMW